MIRGAKSRARRKGLEFDLSNEWAISTLDTANWMCQATGVLMSLAPGRPESISIDRVIPGLGYVRGNCRFVIFAFNQAKGSLLDCEFAELCRLFLQKRENANGNANS